MHIMLYLYSQDYCDKQLETYPFESTSLLRDQAKVLVTLTESLAIDLKRLEIIVQVQLIKLAHRWCLPNSYLYQHCISASLSIKLKPYRCIL